MISQNLARNVCLAYINFCEVRVRLQGQNHHTSNLVCNSSAVFEDVFTKFGNLTDVLST